MKESELNFDRSKHICYSKQIKKIIYQKLLDKYPTSKADELMKKIQLQYVKFLQDLPYLGGKKCTHNGPGGTYDCIFVFAYYEVLEDKPTIEDLYNINNEIFLPPFKRVGKIVNLNRPIIKKLVNKVFCAVAKADSKWEKDCPTSYIMRVEPYDKDRGIYYRFYRCPIAEFAKANGYLHIMPAFCNSDYPGIEAMHGGLIRDYTCSNGSYCDYNIVGSNDEKLQQKPCVTDKEGYMRNIVVDDDK